MDDQEIRTYISNHLSLERVPSQDGEVVIRLVLEYEVLSEVTITIQDLLLGTEDCLGS